MHKLPALRAAELTSSVSRNAWELKVSQVPLRGYVLAASKRGHSAKGPDKRPLDPPAVVEFVVKDKDRFKSYLWSPYFFCTTTLVPQDGEPSKCDMLTGCLTSSLHIIQQDDKEKTYRGYFVFGDLCPQISGRFQLRFTVFEMRQGPESMFATKLNSVLSPVFSVETCSKIPPPMPSTALSKMLSDGGVKLRIRKEPTPKTVPKVSEWNVPAQPQAAMPHQSLPTDVLGARYASHSIPTGGNQYMPNAIDISNRIRVQHRESTWPYSAPEAGQHQMVLTPASNSFWHSQLPSAVFPQYLDAPSAQVFQGHAPTTQLYQHQTATQAFQMNAQTAHYFTNPAMAHGPQPGTHFTPLFPSPGLNHVFQEDANGMRYFQGSGGTQAPLTTAHAAPLFGAPAVAHSPRGHDMAAPCSQSSSVPAHSSSQDAPYLNGPAVTHSPELAGQGSTYIERPAVTFDQYFQGPAETYAPQETAPTAQYIEHPAVPQAQHQNVQGMHNFLDLAMNQVTNDSTHAEYLQRGAVSQAFSDGNHNVQYLTDKDSPSPYGQNGESESYRY